MSEFEDIQNLFRPICFGAPEALGLRDDAALIPEHPGFELVISKDSLVCGIHLLDSATPDQYARKLVRSNLSDLAAKGAKPYGAFLGVFWSKAWGFEDRQVFALALKDDFAKFGLCLFGGDTVITPGPFQASLTVLGLVPKGRMVQRSTARAKDRIFVTGTVGDAGLGLLLAKGQDPNRFQDRLIKNPGFTEAEALYLINRYYEPEPRLALSGALQAYAHAAVDISDGLLADIAHIGKASGLKIKIDLDRIPLSKAAQTWLQHQDDQAKARLYLATCGDDYEVAFCLAPDQCSDFMVMADICGLRVQDIGHVEDGSGLDVCFCGSALMVSQTGWQHF